MNSVGLSAELQVIRVAADFQHVNTAMYNALGGADAEWTPEMQNTWLKYSAMNARLFDRDYDFVVIHDPQPAGILSAKLGQTGRQPAGKWIWHCHLDLRDAQPEVWDLLRRHVEHHDAIVFSSAEYARLDLQARQTGIISPAIDPLGPRNAELSRQVTEQVLHQQGIDSQRPLVCQIARFDRWNDPVGAAEAYRLAKQPFPELQLILVATVEPEDDLSWSQWQQIAQRSREDRDLHLLSSVREVGNTEMNAFQRAADVCLQMSVKKGFAVPLLEAMWKGRPVVGGRSGAMPLQIVDGLNGFLVQDPSESARRIAEILSDPAAGQAMGERGRELAAEKYSITSYLREYLQLFRSLVDADQPATRFPG
jgi:trehalose synthase